MSFDNNRNTLPAVPNAVTIITKSADFPCGQVVTTFLQNTGPEPTLMQLCIHPGEGRMHVVQCEVPPFTEIDGLVDKAMSLALPAGVTAIKGSGPDKGSILYQSTADLFRGLRVTVTEPAKTGSILPSDDRTQERAGCAYWGETAPQPAFAL